jgi:hypothetical protein
MKRYGISRTRKQSKWSVFGPPLIALAILLFLMFGGITLCTSTVIESSKNITKEDLQDGIANGVVETKKFFKGIKDKIEEKETQ